MSYYVRVGTGEAAASRGLQLANCLDCLRFFCFNFNFVVRDNFSTIKLLGLNCSRLRTSLNCLCLDYSVLLLALV